MTYEPATQAQTRQGLLPRLSGYHQLRWAGLISMLVATCNVMDDLILQYHPQGYDGTLALLGIAPWRVFTGHFLGVLTLPLEIIGYWFICTLMLKQIPRLSRVLFWIMVYGVIIGTVFHGTFTAMIFAGQAESTAPANLQSNFLILENQLTFAIVPLSLIFLGCYLTMWVVFTITVLRHASPFPRWIVLFTPALWSILIVLVYESHIVSWLGNLLYPTVLSLPHLVFYLFCTMPVWRKGKVGYLPEEPGPPSSKLDVQEVP